MPFEDDPGDLGAADAFGGKLGISAGIDPLEIIGPLLRGGDGAEDASEVPDRRDQGEIEQGTGNRET